MKKVISVVLLVLMTLRAHADEGMWLPMLLGEQVYKEMLKKGLKLKAEQLYSMNQASIKDAIIIFGGGCTGEIVSAQGLIFTNTLRLWSYCSSFEPGKQLFARWVLGDGPRQRDSVTRA